MASSQLCAAAVSGSPARPSKSRLLLEYATSELRERDVPTTLVDLATLPADGLLGRGRDADVEAALAAVLGANIIVVSTPVYRASYSGLLKVFFDLLPADSLVGRVGVPIATGGGAAHQLVLDHALRPLFASLGASVVATGTYGTDAQFAGDAPQHALLERINYALAEALVLARALRAPTETPAVAAGGVR